MYSYSVGHLYHSSITHWPDAPIYQYRAGHHELLLFFDAPSTAEIQSIRLGTAQFAFTVQNNVIVFLYEFAPGVPRGDAPFSIHLIPLEERIIPAEPETERAQDILNIILVDAGTGIIEAMRKITFTPQFTAALRSAIRTQATQPFIERQHHLAVDALHANISTNALWDQAIAQNQEPKNEPQRIQNV